MSTGNPENPAFIKKITAGPMLEENGKFMIGSFILVEATREEAQAFVDNDPFKKASSAIVGQTRILMLRLLFSSTC